MQMRTRVATIVVLVMVGTIAGCASSEPKSDLTVDVNDDDITVAVSEAVARGLVTRAVPADRFEQEVRDCMMRIAAGSPRAARENKRNIRRLAASGGRYTEHQLDESFGFLESEDYREGTAAFIAKRPPRFTGR